jgi:rod shape determining protein RodA
MKAKDWRQFDWALLVAFLTLCAIGTLEIYNSTQIQGESPFLTRQLVRLAFGCLIFLPALVVNYRVFLSNMAIIYLAGMGALIYVLFFGIEIHGSRSWLQLGGINVQPSEFVKIIVILALAKFLAEIQDRYIKALPMLLSGLIVFVPCLLIYWQRDLGTALTFPPVYFAMLMLSGIRRQIVIVSVLILILVLCGSWFILKDYQKDRILVIFNPEQDAHGRGYQTIQSVIAIGSGGFTGRGLGQGSQGAMGFLPERQTDFIFSIIGEEMGFLGAAAVLLLYLFIFYRGLLLAYETRDKAAMYACVGIVALYAVHLFINVGMTLGLLPVIGIPLPPLSYGGSSLVTAFVAIGLLNNFKIHRYVV